MGYGRNSLEGFFVCGILSHQDPNWFAFELCLKQIDFEYFVQMLRWRPQDDLTKSGLYQHGSSRSVCIYMGVSKNNGTPKSSILIGFSIINHPFWGTPIFGNTHIYT